MGISTIFSSAWDNLTSVPERYVCGRYLGKYPFGEVNCASHGDISSYCIYSHRCACGYGYVCEKPYIECPACPVAPNQCAVGAVCVPGKDYDFFCLTMSYIFAKNVDFCHIVTYHKCFSQ